MERAGICPVNDFWLLDSIVFVLLFNINNIIIITK